MQGRGEKTVLINGLPTVIPENIPVYKIGDCIEPRSAKAAIYEAALISRSI